MATIIITEADLARDVAGALAKVREGNKLVVQRDGVNSAIIEPPTSEPRTASDCLAIAESLGPWPIPDEDFAHDVQEGIAARNVPWNPPEWD